MVSMGTGSLTHAAMRMLPAWCAAESHPEGPLLTLCKHLCAALPKAGRRGSLVHSHLKGSRWPWPCLTGFISQGSSLKAFSKEMAATAIMPARCKTDGESRWRKNIQGQKLNQLSTEHNQFSEVIIRQKEDKTHLHWNKTKCYMYLSTGTHFGLHTAAHGLAHQRRN